MERIDMVGEQYGRLTVLSYAGNSKWRCICECGNQSTVHRQKLISSHTRSCGCLAKMRDLTGNIYNSWMVIKFIKREGDRYFWECECECGTRRIIGSTIFRHGASKHCGCKRSLIGKKFNLLTVVDKERIEGVIYWQCICDCGNTTRARTSYLKNGSVKSCGCLRHGPAHNRTHGLAGTILYKRWAAMIGRCYNPNDDCYKWYGGRGIEICESWRHNYMAFHNWCIFNGYEKSLKLDRINNDGNYEPDNCRWTTQKVQCNNTRRNVIVSIQGENLNLKQASEKYKLPYGTIMTRYRVGKRGEELIK